MDWKRRKSITNLVDGILECNVLKKPPVLLFDDIMKKREITFEECNEDDEEFCGVYMIRKNKKIIFVNSNLYEPRKNFTIAHELGHDFLGHQLSDGAIICNHEMLFGKNKPEQEKEADYFACCFLMNKSLMLEKKKEFDENQSSQLSLFQNANKQEYIANLNKYLRDYFKVSKEAMGYRLEELKFV